MISTARVHSIGAKACLAISIYTRKNNKISARMDEWLYISFFVYGICIYIAAILPCSIGLACRTNTYYVSVHEVANA